MSKLRTAFFEEERIMSPWIIKSFQLSKDVEYIPFKLYAA
jgi:hypothetical protein